MHVEQAMLPGPDISQDRLFVTDNAVVMLDGASAFIPVEVSPATYADMLGRFIVDHLTKTPDAELRDVLATAIEQTADRLQLVPGASPSSTVAIARVRGSDVDLLVLGDTQIVTPHATLIDERVSQVAADQRTAYRARLAAGHGYDKAHRQLLADLQAEQGRWRNREGGFWIAEALPGAAERATTISLPAPETPWLVLATDGAHKPLAHLGLDRWEEIARSASHELTLLLDEIQAWESDVDPDGTHLPRAKRHDDKTIAAMTVSQATTELPVVG